jgi:hypothetical protein
MAKRPPKASANEHAQVRSLPTPPRRARARSKSSAPQAQKLGFSSLVGELKRLREHGGSVVGAAYARAASIVLDRLEHFEDQNAERRLRRRANPRASGRKPLPDSASPTQENVSTLEAGV